MGSTRVVLSESGQRVEAADYYAFGLKMPTRSAGTSTKHWNTGKERDTETGWDYFGARYYNPAIARWMNVDPMAEKYPSLSSYNYVNNTPTMIVDPNGEDWIWDREKSRIYWDANVSAADQVTQEGLVYLGKKVIYDSWTSGLVYGNEKGEWFAGAWQLGDTREFYQYRMGAGEQIFGSHLPEGTDLGKGLGNAIAFLAKEYTFYGPLMQGIEDARYGKYKEATINFGMVAVDFIPVGKLAKMAGGGVLSRVIKKADEVAEVVPNQADEVVEAVAEGAVGNLNIVNEIENGIEGFIKYNDGRVIEFLTEKRIVGDRLELSNIAFYPAKAGNEAANSFGVRTMLETMEMLKGYAKAQGFKELRIHGVRAMSSSSANPGHVIDKIFKL